MQPIIKDSQGIFRFKENEVVHWMLGQLRKNGVTLNEYPFDDFPVGDINQFYQLIGYSVSGYGDLTLVSRRSVKEADKAVEVLMAKEGG